MPLLKLRGGSSHLTSRRAKGVRKISSKDTTKRNNLAKQTSLRIKNSRQAGLKVHFKAILKECKTESRLKCKFETKATSFRTKLSLTRMVPRESTLPLLLSPNVMYSLHCMGSRLENHFEHTVMWREQPELMSHVFSRPPTCINRKTWSEQMVQHWG